MFRGCSVFLLCCILCMFYGLTKSYGDGGPRHRNYKYVSEVYNNNPTPAISNGPAAQRFVCRTFGMCGTRFDRQIYRSKFESVFEWKQMDFDYPKHSDREYDIKTGNFIPGMPTPIDVDVYYGPGKNRTVFVTMPRFQAGIPATLGTVVTSKLTGDQVIKPYPCWKWHQHPEKCREDRLVSVYRVKVDNCNRLWVLDTGRLSTGQVCPMQILAFDLETNKLVHRHAIPESLLEPISILVTPIVEILNEQCADTFVYIADCQLFSIIVHDVKRRVSWKATDKTMYPYPNHGTFRIQGDHFDLMDGVLGMDLGPKIPGQDRKLFYHALTSVTENWVSTAFLRNQSLFEHYPEAHPELFHTYKGTRQSQSASEAIDRNGIAFFGQMSETTINCWNTATEYGYTNIDIVERNPETLQFPCGVKVIDNPKGYQELWILTSRLQKVIVRSLQQHEVNFRIQKIKVNDAVRATKCKKSWNA